MHRGGDGIRARPRLQAGGARQIEIIVAVALGGNDWPFSISDFA